jgi:hypothetical protein
VLVYHVWGVVRVPVWARADPVYQTGLTTGLCLGLRCIAVGLRHGHKALSLAAVLAFTAVFRGLALGGALTGIHTGALDRRGIRSRGHSDQPGREKHRGRNRQRRTRPLVDLHVSSPLL